MSTAGKSEYAWVLGPYQSPNRVHTKMWLAGRQYTLQPSAILYLWNSNFLTVGAVKRPILHHCTKFGKDRSNRCGDIAIFVMVEKHGKSSPINSTHYARLYPQNGERIVTIESMTSLHPMYTRSIYRPTRICRKHSCIHTFQCYYLFGASVYCVFLWHSLLHAAFCFSWQTIKPALLTVPRQTFVKLATKFL